MATTLDPSGSQLDPSGSHRSDDSFEAELLSIFKDHPQQSTVMFKWINARATLSRMQDQPAYSQAHAVWIAACRVIDLVKDDYSKTCRFLDKLTKSMQKCEREVTGGSMPMKRKNADPAPAAQIPKMNADPAPAAHTQSQQRVCERVCERQGRERQGCGGEESRVVPAPVRYEVDFNEFFEDSWCYDQVLGVFPSLFVCEGTTIFVLTITVQYFQVSEDFLCAGIGG